MPYQMVRIPVTLSELEDHFCCYDWQNASCCLTFTSQYQCDFR